MIGSPNGFYGVFDGDGSSFGYFPPTGSGDIEKQFEAYMSAHGKLAQPLRFGNGSDYVGFLDVGVPVGGLFTGAPPQSNCYHTKRDNIDNINWEILTFIVKVCAVALPPEGQRERREEEFGGIS